MPDFDATITLNDHHVSSAGLSAATAVAAWFEVLFGWVIQNDPPEYPVDVGQLFRASGE